MQNNKRNRVMCGKMSNLRLGHSHLRFNRRDTRNPTAPNTQFWIIYESKKTELFSEVILKIRSKNHFNRLSRMLDIWQVEKSFHEKHKNHLNFWSHFSSFANFQSLLWKTLFNHARQNEIQSSPHLIYPCFSDYNCLSLWFLMIF